MGQRIYTAPIDNANVGTAVQDIFSLLAGAATGIELHHLHLEAGGVNIASEIRMRFKRGC